MKIDLSECVSGIPLRSLERDASVLSPEEFEDRYGRGFLLATAADLEPGDGPRTTEVSLDGDGVPRGEVTASLSFLVFPLRQKRRSVGHLITLGRTADNDVMLSDRSVSRLHAYLKETDGRFQIQDTGSSNGTLVNRKSVAVQGQGEPSDLKTGDNVRLGQVEFTFLDADALREFVAAGAR